MSDETPRQRHLREFLALCEETEAGAREGCEGADRELAAFLEPLVALFALFVFCAVAWCLSS